MSLTLIAMMMGACAFAQLYVSPDSFVYSNDQYVFVKQDVNLAGNGNLYLRNGSQLLQGVSGPSTNSGAGKLSVFQEGTVDNFEYNYWCSPVGNASVASGNESFGITMLNQPTGLISSNAAQILPMSNTNGVSDPLKISQRWIYKFITSDNYSQWIAVNSASTLAAGEGFTMKGTGGLDLTEVQGVANNPGSNQRYDFRGKPNDGDISISVGLDQMTLTGNPYPSAINLSQFLTSATNSTGVAYFWEQDKTLNTHVLVNYSGGYGVYAPVNMMGPGIYTPAVFFNYEVDGELIPGSNGIGGNYTRYMCPIGQGFLIKGTTNGVVTMRNQYRVFQKEDPTLSQFERAASSGADVASVSSQYLPNIPNVAGFDYTQVSASAVPQIRFSAKIGQGIRTLVLGFDPAATDGPDHAMDAQSGDANAIDLFFAMDSKEYLISVIDFAPEKRIPLGLRNLNGPATFQITMNEMLNFSGASHVYVHDKINNTYFEITNAVYEVTMPAGLNTDRFELTFTESSLVTPILATDSFVIVQDNPHQQLSISNPNNFDIKSVSLYDMTGKQVLDSTNLGALGQYHFATDGLSEAVYIVKIKTADNRDIAQKISVYRTNN